MQSEFTLGIEEEYLLVDRDSLELAEAPPALMEACQNDLQDQVSPEFLQCQIEIGTKVCGDIRQPASIMATASSGVPASISSVNDSTAAGPA